MNQSKYINQRKEVLIKLFPYFLYLFLSSIIWYCIPSFSTQIENDSHAYLSFLKTFQKTGSFYPGVSDQLHTWFGIGYPWFMYCCSFFSKKLEAIIFVQIILGLTSIYLLQKTALFFINKKYGYLIAFLAAVNIGYLMYPLFLLTESLMLFFVSFLFFLLTCTYLSIGLQLFLIGFVGSLTFLIKPTLLYLLPFWGLFLIYQRAQVFSWKKKIVFFLFFLLMVASVPAGMIGYYKSRFGQYYFKSVDKVNIYYFYLPHLLAQHENRPFLEIQNELHQKYPIVNFADPNAWNGIDPLLKETIKKDPFLAINVWFIEMLKTLCGLYTNHLKVLLYPEIKGGDCSFFYFSGSFFERLTKYLCYGNVSSIFVLLGIIEIVMRIFFILFGFVAALRIIYYKNWIYFWSILFPLVYFWAITGADGSGRLRLLMEPFWMMLIMLEVKNIENYYNRS